MNSTRSMVVVAFCLLLAFSACTSKEETSSDFTYNITVKKLEKNNAPALQSFVHGVSGDQWLLFAGRTNRMNDDGGLHGIVNGDYAAKSFLPLSYNEDIFVYDVSEDTVSGMSLDDIKAAISANSSLAKAQLTVLNEYATVFRNSNPLVTQEGDYLYMVGGYGTPLSETTSSKAYQTFDQVAKIHVPSMIALIREDYKNVDWDELMAFGKNKKLISTGAELFVIGEKLYLAGGHNFTYSSQQYVDAVYPFSITRNLGGPTLTVKVDDPITDISPDSLGTAWADANSKFRRRDGPVVPSLYKLNGQLREGLTFYSGVFQPDSTVVTDETDKNGKVTKKTTNWMRAWPTAIYITPEGTTKYKIDKAYKQSQNVYATAEFEFYDDSSDKIYTYLVGGIGDGTSAGPLQLSGFTNSTAQIVYELNSQTSTWSIEDKNAYNSQQFYGAESIFIFSNDSKIQFIQTADGMSEVVDINKTLGGASSIDLGYIFGGIESFESNPGTFGQGKSRASNKIWKVTLTKKSN